LAYSFLPTQTAAGQLGVKQERQDFLCVPFLNEIWTCLKLVVEFVEDIELVSLQLLGYIVFTFMLLKTNYLFGYVDVIRIEFDLVVRHIGFIEFKSAH
jgi:hypothetical protein